MSAHPRFGLLGPLRVLDAEGRPADLGGPRQRALLAILLLEPGKVVPAERLVTLLWGDGPPAKPLANLQSYVSHLRRALEPARGDRTAPTVLGYRGGGYVVDVDPHETDVRRFEDAAAAGAQALADGRWEDAADRLDAGLALWRGPALADVADEPFAIAAARRLEDLRLAAREDRLEVDLHLGRAAAAAAGAAEVLAEHPYRERLVRIQLLGLYRSGRQADALRAANLFRERLGDELGLDPSPELQRLELDILQQSPALDVELGVAATPPGPTSPITPLTPPAPADRPPGAGILPTEATRTGNRLVGRANELEIVHGIVEDVVSGRGRVAAIVGEPGIGKTRLAQELAAVAAAAGADVHWARCVDGDATPALWPWAQVLRSISQRLGDRSPAVEGPHGAILATLVPGMVGAAGTPVTDPGDAEISRLWLFDAAVAYLRAAAAVRPLVLVLDDAQWMDSPSLRLLQAAAVELTGEGTGAPAAVAMVATIRTHDPGTNPLVPGAATELARLAGARRIHLHGLRLDDVTEVLTDVLGSPVDPQLAETVARRSAGNPFFVREIGELVAGDPDQAGQVPTRVRELVARRFKGLPGGSDRVLSTAAVLGRTVDLDTLEAMMDLTADELLDLLDAAVAARMLRDDETVVGRFHFTHDLVRETLLAQLSAVRRARLHARAFEVLEPRAGDASGPTRAEVAHHAVEAAALVGVDRAVDAVVAVADDPPTGRIAFEDWATLCRRALAALDPMLDDRSRGRLLYALGDALCSTPAWAEGQAILDDVLRLARRVGDNELFAIAALDYGGGALLSFWIDHRAYDPLIVQQLEEARRGVAEGSVLHTELACRLAVELYAQDALERRVELADGAVARALELGIPRVICEALICRLLAGWTSGDAEDRLALAERAMVAAEEANEPLLHFVGVHYRVCSLLELGRIEEVEAAIPGYLRAVAASPSRSVLIASGWLRATLAVLKGRHAEAEQALEGARHHASRHRPGGSAAVNAALVLLQYDQGVVLLDNPVLPPEGLGGRSFGRVAATGRELARQGDRAGAERVAATLPAIIDDSPDDFALTTGLAITAELAHDLQDSALAARCRPLLERLTGRLVVLGAGLACLGAVEHYAGLAAAVCGDAGAARERLTAALAVHERLGSARLAAASRAALTELGSA
jgi:DNA-binding SARP family transcriptional activator